ncbi:DUF3885 domain-containing protein [Streptomyces endophytica]|uniref:DUF3885 domain-containing protein n=1 Tax=Streptomyces endophytica TaxID=2991496 RepID=A0ABY6P7S3_9ACTN|nr:hypothetical protein [Streptomyces endophytica]UZJ29831.1 hypothetical protein OJ254_04465 [Streptomyces endophytica]
MSLGLDREELTTLWQRQWPMGPPIAHELRAAYSDRWVRFHNLPGSKRHPETEDEYAVVLDRNNTVLDELFAGTDVYVVTTAWSSEPNGPERPTRRRKVHAAGSSWMTIANEADPDPEFHTYTHLYADRRPWQRGSLDSILREVAHDALSGVIITDTGLQHIHHPYDGGADIILTTPEERDELRNRHTDWLSQHPTGL